MEIRKSSCLNDPEGDGHCYNEAGFCDYWNQKVKCCALFRVWDKEDSLALKMCDKIYGSNYEGRI